MSDQRPVFLVGFMGSGKSTVGRRLAQELGREFVDTDREVERAEGRAVAEIFAADGESAFRAAEWRVLRSLEGRDPYVAAAGGGIVESRRARGWLRRRARTVWLSVPLAVVRSRIGSGADRPAWPADDRVAQRALFARRRALYGLAEILVDAAPDDPVEIVRRILARL